ncbi:MAG: hypothetical protein JNJ94_15750 [Chlorobi bacterium]|nr:hypothetical protein [Chlorobiota bacterium]
MVYFLTLSALQFFSFLTALLAQLTSTLGAEKGDWVAHRCTASWASLLVRFLLRLAIVKLAATAWAELFATISSSSAVAADGNAQELNSSKCLFVWQ